MNFFLLHFLIVCSNSTYNPIPNEKSQEKKNVEKGKCRTPFKFFCYSNPHTYALAQTFPWTIISFKFIRNSNLVFNFCFINIRFQMKFHVCQFPPFVRLRIDQKVQLKRISFSLSQSIRRFNFNFEIGI